MDWIVTSHMYKRLLEIATKYRLLNVYAEYEPPVRDHNGRMLSKGRARLIGPGAALPERNEAFQKFLDEHQSVIKAP